MLTFNQEGKDELLVKLQAHAETDQDISFETFFSWTGETLINLIKAEGKK